jgi:hypothetical protein
MTMNRNPFRILLGGRTDPPSYHRDREGFLVDVAIANLRVVGLTPDRRTSFSPDQQSHRSGVHRQASIPPVHGARSGSQ